jgi:hypothetical protein
MEFSVTHRFRSKFKAKNLQCQCRKPTGKSDVLYERLHGGELLNSSDRMDSNYPCYSPGTSRTELCLDTEDVVFADQEQRMHQLPKRKQISSCHPSNPANHPSSPSPSASTSQTVPPTTTSGATSMKTPSPPGTGTLSQAPPSTMETLPLPVKTPNSSALSLSSGAYLHKTGTSAYPQCDTPTPKPAPFPGRKPGSSLQTMCNTS